MENVPSESETIAIKRSNRLKQKIKDARNLILSKSEWWADGPVEFLGVLLILILNFLVLINFFGTYSNYLVFSGPVVPILSKLISLSGIPLNYSVQFIYLMFIMAFPVVFYFFVKKLTLRKFPAFISTLIISLPVYPFLYSRVESGILGTDGSFIASLPAIFISLSLLIDHLRGGLMLTLIKVSISSAVVALFSPFGFFCFFILAFITTFSEMLLGDGRTKFLRFIITMIFAGSLCSFWYNPAFFIWMITGEMGHDLRELVKKLIPISFFSIPVLATAGYLLFDRKPYLQPLFLSTFYTIVFAIFALAGHSFVPGNPGRYIHVFGISLGLLIGIGILNFLEYLESLKKVKNYLLGGLCIVLIVTTFLVRTNVYNKDDNVLGIFTDVEKGDIWLAKEGFGNKYSFFGYIITASGVAGLTYLKKYSKMPQI